MTENANLTIEINDATLVLDEKDIDENVLNILLKGTRENSVLILVKACKNPINYTFSECFKGKITILLDESCKKAKRYFTLMDNTNIVFALADFCNSKREINFTTKLLGENARAVFSLSTLVKAKSIKNFSINFDHIKENTTSSMINYGVILDRSQLVFSGNSLINNNVEGCEAHQKTKIIVFDANAVAKANPNLLINNNKVIASHAATVGRINEDHLFYMQSRGLSEETAKTLIVKGYLEPIINFYDEEKIRTQLINYLEGAFQNVWC